MIEALIIVLAAGPVESVVLFWFIAAVGLAIIPAGIAADKGHSGWVYWLISAVSLIAGTVLVMRLPSGADTDSR